MPQDFTDVTFGKTKSDIIIYFCFRWRLFQASKSDILIAEKEKKSLDFADRRSYELLHETK